MASVVTVPATPMPCSGSLPVRNLLPKERAYGQDEILDLAALRRIVRQEALGQAHATDVEARVEADPVRASERELGRASAEVDHERERLDWPRGGDSAKGEDRFLLAGQEARREVELRFELSEEARSVGRVAHGARRVGERTRPAEPLDGAVVLANAVRDAHHRLEAKRSRLVYTLAEPGDRQAAVELTKLAILDVRDQEPGRVRPEVDDADPRHLLGMRPRATPTTIRTSSSAHASTRVFAIEPSSATLASANRACAAAA